jgi:ribosomal protein S15P/S13E
MPSSHESSVLRSLAIAFGDGLAFGAGMKLSQRAASPTGSAPIQPMDLAPLLKRIAEVEKRVAESGRVSSARSIAAGAATFDQKVLEAVVAALDARLNEHAGHTESRVAQLEARLAIELKSLHQRDHSVESAVETRVEELTAYFDNQIAALRRHADEDRQAESSERLLAELEDRLAVELQSLHRQDLSLEAAVEKRVNELSSNLDIQIAALRRQADEDRHAIRSEMVAMRHEFAEEAARAVERRVEEVVGRHADLLRAELEHKDDQIGNCAR